MSEQQKELLNRAVGLLIVEVVDSNPNGDPDTESDPRVRTDENGNDYGEISSVSFKRKLRDLVDDKDGPVWTTLAAELGLDAERFQILESRGRDRKEVAEKSLEDFKNAYWDARVFGSTFLEKKEKKDDKDKNGKNAKKRGEEIAEAEADAKEKKFIRTGVVQFGLGVSIAPITIERATLANKAGVQEGKDRGMAPLGFRVVRHGVYAMPFFVNPSAAVKTGCSREDVELMLRLIPYAYRHTASFIRSDVRTRVAWCAEHKTPLGNCSDFAVLDALRPKRKGDDPTRPSTCWDDYDVPTELAPELRAKFKAVRDLVAEADAR